MSLQTVLFTSTASSRANTTLSLPHGVAASDQGQSASRSVDLSGTDLTVQMDLSTRRIHGVLTLGTEPLAASLEFLSTAGTASFTSDDKGKFEGLLPAVANKWDVRVV